MRFSILTQPPNRSLDRHVGAQAQFAGAGGAVRHAMMVEVWLAVRPGRPDITMKLDPECHVRILS
jgi:hypothetical protein